MKFWETTKPSPLPGSIAFLRSSYTWDKIYHPSKKYYSINLPPCQYWNNFLKPQMLAGKKSLLWRRETKEDTADDYPPTSQGDWNLDQWEDSLNRLKVVIFIDCNGAWDLQKLFLAFTILIVLVCFCLYYQNYTKNLWIMVNYGNFSKLYCFYFLISSHSLPCYNSFTSGTWG